TDSYKLVSRKWKAGVCPVEIDAELKIGDGELAIMGGPCSIEGEDQIRETVAHLAANGVKIMRGGVYKPRSSPYSFRGLGIDGLKLWHQLCKEHGIRIITEVMHTEQIAEMLDYVDIFQVGARNSQNFNLLDALGETRKPVMLKRGMSGTLEELLQSAEYIFCKGNEQILLCERGIRTFEKSYRNTLDLNAIPVLKEKTHLPVIVDPSHGIGVRRYVGTMALAGIMAGADGVIVEVHSCPEKAFSDGQQTLDYAEASALYRKMRKVHHLREEL
ncbi:MAG: 3-deoxy-7-phosphoheptulonate synthase, partial [Bacteroidota bacterium]